MAILKFLTIAVLALFGFVSVCAANTMTFVSLGPSPLDIWTTQGVKGATAQYAVSVADLALEVLTLLPGWSGMFEAIAAGANPADPTVINEVTSQ